MSTLAKGVLAGGKYASHCEGKERHPTEAAARAALRLYQAEGALRTCSGLEPYKCDFCPDWHLGHVRAGAPRTFGVVGKYQINARQA